jgi:hypothetical protein
MGMAGCEKFCMGIEEHGRKLGRRDSEKPKTDGESWWN